MIEAEITSVREPGLAVLLAKPVFTMSSDEWAERYQAMIAASLFRDEQERFLLSARIVDQPTAIDGYFANNELTSAEFASGLSSALAANPGLITKDTVAELQRELANRARRRPRK